jgi:hypothetical protein
MESELLNWMIADFSFLGLRVQNWMLVFAGCFVLYGCVNLFKGQQRHD